MPVIPLNKTQQSNLVRMIEGLQSDPVAFFKLQWPDEKIWPKQEEICRSVVTNKRTYVRACHSSSKTHTAARLAIWWLSCFQPSIVVTTAPTFTQVETILWGNMRGAKARAKFSLPGSILPSAPNWKIGDEYYGIGLSVKDIDRFQGFHTPSGRVLVILDEGSGVPDKIAEAVDALLTGENTRLLEIGNPLRPSGHFYNAHKNGITGRIHISGLEAVKYSKEIPGLIDQSYLDEQKAKYDAGNNPMYLPRCLGEFPDTSIDTVLDLKDVETAINNPMVLVNEAFEFFAIDWAYGGANETTIDHWRGSRQDDQLCFSKKDPEDAIGRIIAWIRARGGKDIFHDNCGGGRIYGSLLKASLGKEYTVHDIDSGAPGDDTYENLRAMMWFNAREMLHTGGVGLLNCPVVKEQLLCMTYFHNRRGKILVAGKDDIVADYGWSPDRGDRTVYGLWGLKIMRQQNVTPKTNWRWWEKENTGDSSDDLLGVRGDG